MSLPAPYKSVFARHARIAGVWANDVLVRIDAHGLVSSVAVGAKPTDAQYRCSVLLPSIPNLHSHCFQRAMVARAERRSATGDDFWRWRSQMYRVAGNVEPDDLEAIAYLNFIEMLEGGYTSVCEFHYIHLDTSGRPYRQSAEMPLRIIAAAQRAGIRLTLLPVLYQRAGFREHEVAPEQRRFALSTEAYLRLIETLQSVAERDDAISVGLAPHSMRAVDPAAIREIVAWRGRANPRMPLHIHVSEQRAEVEECLAFNGETPIDLLAGTVELDGHVCLVHATHATEDELVRVAESGATVALCPTTEANLGDGIFPLRDYQRLGGRWGIGSDAQVCRRAFSELRLLEYGQRLSLLQRCVAATEPGQSTGEVLFDLATDQGSRVTAQPAGRIAVGEPADFIAYPRVSAHDLLLDQLLFDENSRQRGDVICRGRRLVTAGRHVESEFAYGGFEGALLRLYA